MLPTHFQSGTNAELNKQLWAPVWTGILVYVTRLAGLLLVQLALREAFPFPVLTASFASGKDCTAPIDFARESEA